MASGDMQAGMILQLEYQLDRIFTISRRADQRGAVMGLQGDGNDFCGAGGVVIDPNC